MFSFVLSFGPNISHQRTGVLPCRHQPPDVGWDSGLPGDAGRHDGPGGNSPRTHGAPQQMTARIQVLQGETGRRHSTWRRFPQVMTSPANRKVDTEQTSYERRAEVDPRSIFIGNLPEDLDSLDRDVRNMAGEIGHVVDVQVVRKAGRPAHSIPCSSWWEIISSSHPTAACLCWRAILPSTAGEIQHVGNVQIIRKEGVLVCIKWPTTSTSQASSATSGLAPTQSHSSHTTLSTTVQSDIVSHRDYHYVWA
ncbi:hypothetical protein PG996_007520 [Apiospora saccharicola]|uniref:RRM domain-containing protein n=1 Tax=Apiospora saccharicola TaxID=335842 RepID=A0ABR1VB51_9PEZI